MPLSQSKLEKLLLKHNFDVARYYTSHKTCVYLEVVNSKNSDMFLLYIPPKYEIRVSGFNTVKMQYVPLDGEGNIVKLSEDISDRIPEKFADDPDDYNIEEKYKEIDLASSPTDRKDLLKHMEENYNRPITLKDMTRGDRNSIKEMYRQLRRFKFCVQSLKYKLALSYKNFVCCIGEEDEIESFLLSSRFDDELDKKRRLLVTIDLEAFFTSVGDDKRGGVDSVARLVEDLKTVREGVYRVLDKNQGKNARHLYTLLQQNNNIIAYSNRVHEEKEKVKKYIKELEGLLAQLNESEKVQLEKIRVVEGKYEGRLGLHNDIEKTHEVGKYSSKLDKLNEVRGEIRAELEAARLKRERIMLSVDKIFFDNTIMLDTILKNMKSLEKLEF